MRVLGQPIRVGSGPTDVVVAGGAAWTSNYEDDTLTRVDARTGEPVATIPVGDGPVDVAVGFGAVWAANVEEDTLSRVNPEPTKWLAPPSRSARHQRASRQARGQCGSVTSRQTP